MVMSNLLPKTDTIEAQAGLISASESAFTSSSASVSTSLSVPSVINAVTVPNSESAQTFSLSGQQFTSAASVPLMGMSIALLADRDSQGTHIRKQKRRDEEIEEEKDIDARAPHPTHRESIGATSDSVSSKNKSENAGNSESKRPRLLEQMSLEMERTKLLESRLLGALIPKISKQ